MSNSCSYLEVRSDAGMTPDDDYSFAERLGAEHGADRLLSTRHPRPESRVRVVHRLTLLSA